jgi:hypothetical protein
MGQLGQKLLPSQGERTAQINPVDDADINWAYVGPVNRLGKAEGQGEAKGRDRYVGEFKNGKKSGYGVYMERTGIRYEGQFANDLANGQGVSIFPNGLIYEGEHKDGIFQGQGTLSMRNLFTYTGGFSDSLFNGFGILEKHGQIKIIGDFKNGQLDGFCVVTTPNGKGYQGVFVDGRPNGAFTIFDQQGQEDFTIVFEKGLEKGRRQKLKNSVRKLI